MRGWRQDLLVPLLKGVVLVSYLYHVVACNHGTPFPWKSALQTKVLLIAAFFAWSSVVGRILTMDNLRKRHVIVINMCCMCKKNGEFVGHLFLHCEGARAL
jgi:cytochrome c oxidase assembly factor CtaG